MVEIAESAVSDESLKSEKDIGEARPAALEEKPAAAKNVGKSIWSLWETSLVCLGVALLAGMVFFLVVIVKTFFEN